MRTKSWSHGDVVSMIVREEARELDRLVWRDFMTMTLDRVRQKQTPGTSPMARRRETHALRLRFGLDGQGEHTFAEIGDIFGVGHDRARQIVNHGLYHVARTLGLQHEEAMRKVYGWPIPTELFNERR